MASPSPLSPPPWPPPPGCPAIAELGTAHKGDLIKARELVDAAAEAGAWGVKIQLFYAREILPPNAGLVPLPGGPASLYQEFLTIEKATLGGGNSFYADLRDYALSRGLVFLGSSFGPQSSRLLADLGVPAFKVASPELNYHPMLRQLAACQRPVVLSTGVSLLGDIEEALQVLRKVQPGIEIFLLHCVTAYPAPVEEANLRLIPLLAALFGCPAGLSDHSLDPVLLPALTAALGGRLLEKHLTLDKKAGGLDDPVALTPGEFKTMTQALKEFAGAGEAEARRRLSSAYPPALLSGVLGNGKKNLAPSEKENYHRSNRSLHALEDLPSGTPLSRENSCCLRTEKILRPGIHPRYFSQVMGRCLTRDVPAGEGIRWEDLLSPLPLS